MLNILNPAYINDAVRSNIQQLSAAMATLFVAVYVKGVQIQSQQVQNYIP
jgi:hypothetical protein